MATGYQLEWRERGRERGRGGERAAEEMWI